MEPIKRVGRGIGRTIVLVVFLGVAGFLGWFVWQAKHNTDKTLTNTSQAQGPVTKTTVNKELPPTTPDVTADWTTYSSPKGKFSLRYPKTWVQPLNRDLCSAEIFDRSVYLAPDAGSVLKCGSEYFGQMAVSSVDGDKRSDYDLSSAGYKDVINKEVTINGVVGHRISGVSASSPGAMFAPVDGTIEVHYVFYTPTGITYVARYTQAPKGSSPATDVLNDFDLMVTKTLKFSS